MYAACEVVRRLGIEDFFETNTFKDLQVLQEMFKKGEKKGSTCKLTHEEVASLEHKYIFRERAHDDSIGKTDFLKSILSARSIRSSAAFSFSHICHLRASGVAFTLSKLSKVFFKFGL